MPGSFPKSLREAAENGLKHPIKAGINSREVWSQRDCPLASHLPSPSLGLLLPTWVIHTNNNKKKS